MDALSKLSSIGSEGSQLLWFVLRRTYGFQKKTAEMSISFIAQGTGLKRAAVSRAIKRLATKRLLLREENYITFNKNYDQWVATKRLPPQPNGCPPSNQTVAKVATKRLPKKETLKKTLIKETYVATQSVADSKEIAEAIDAFKTTGLNPEIKFGNTTQRKVAGELIKKYGLEKILNTIKYAASIANDQYAPTITTPLELQEKLGKLIKYNKSHNPSNNYLKVS